MKRTARKGAGDILRRVGGVFSTIGDIATKFDVPYHRIVYILRTRLVTETCRAGNCKLYSPAQVRLIGRLLDEDWRIEKE